MRARAEQLKPCEELRPGVTPLGVCHVCSRVVYAGDSLAMAGGYLLHDGCCGPEPEHDEPR